MADEKVEVTGTPVGDDKGLDNEVHENDSPETVAVKIEDQKAEAQNVDQAAATTAVQDAIDEASEPAPEAPVLHTGIPVEDRGTAAQYSDEEQDALDANEYVVRPNDDFLTIANRFSTSPDALVTLNGRVSGHWDLKPGTTIKLFEDPTTDPADDVPVVDEPAL